MRIFGVHILSKKSFGTMCTRIKIQERARQICQLRDFEREHPPTIVVDGNIYIEGGATFGNLYTCGNILMGKGMLVKEDLNIVDLSQLTILRGVIRGEFVSVEQKLGEKQEEKR